MVDYHLITDLLPAGKRLRICLVGLSISDGLKGIVSPCILSYLQFFNFVKGPGGGVNWLFNPAKTTELYTAILSYPLL